MRLDGDDWTEPELQFLDKYYGKIPVEKICARLQRSICSVQSKANKRGLSSELARSWQGKNFKGAEYYLKILDYAARYDTIRQAAKAAGLEHKSFADKLRKAYKYRDQGKLTCGRTC